MAPAFQRELFINLAVKDLERARAFFADLGFTFNPQFTDDNAACMVIGGSSYAMLLKEGFYRTFTDREPCDTRTHSEVLIAVSCASRAEVDAMHAKALKAGGRTAKPEQDHGFMFVRTFYDLDGHHWEVVWMDPNAVQPT